MAVLKPLDIQYGLSLNGSLVLDREKNLAVKNASIENLTVTGILSAVNSTDTYIKDSNILLNSGIESGAVNSLGSIITGGSGYSQGIYKNIPLVVLSGTAGFGATADIVVDSDGSVVDVTIVNKGSGYGNNTVFTVAAADIDSDDNGTNFSVPVATVTAGSAATNAFITVARGTSGTDVALKWMESNDAFFGTPRWQLTNNGSNYYSIYVTNDADTSATGDKLVLRDGSGNINVRNIDAADGIFTGDVSINGGDLTAVSASSLAVNGYITESNDGGANYWNVVTQYDIGYESSQVPLNQYLGQLAFLDDYHPNGLRRDGGGYDDVFVDASGNVGIGTISPSYKLHVEGDVKIAELGTLWFSDVGGSIEKITSTTSTIDYYSDSQHRFFESDSNVKRFTIDVNNSSGRVFFDNDTDTYFTRQDTDCHVFVNAGTESLRIDASNNVGIGTATPTAKLDVNGSFNVAGASTFASDVDINASLDVLNSLGVTGTSTFASDVDINASLDVLNSLGVTGTSTFASDVDINASLNILNSLDVTGISSFSDIINIGTIFNVAFDDTLNEGTLSIESPEGQLFTISNNRTTGSLFSVSDVSGSVSIDVNVDGTISLAPYIVSEYVGIGTTTPTAKLDVNGTFNVSGLSTFQGIDVTGHIETDTLNVSGVSTFQGNVNLGDNDKAIFGDGGDLEIYHNGSNSYIRDIGTGNLNIDSADGNVQIRVNTNEFAIIAKQNSSVELYYDNSKKFETTDAGVTISGIATATTFYAPGGSFDAGSGTIPDASIVIDENSAIYTKDGTNLRVLIEKQTKIINIGQFNTSLIDAIEFKPGNAGSVKLHHGGTTDNVKLQTTTSGIEVTGHIETDTLNVSGVSTFQDNVSLGDNNVLQIGNSADLKLFHDGSNSYVRDFGAGRLYLDGSSVHIRSNSNELAIEANQNAEVSLYYDNSKKLETTTYGIYVTGVDANTSTIGGAATLVLDPAAIGDNTGKVVVLGDLQVDGTTTTLNSTTLTIDDKNIVLASGAADSTAADGAGISVDGASATLTYNSTPDAWSFNKNLGIGTAAPEEILHLENDGQIHILLKRTDQDPSECKISNSGNVLRFSNNAGGIDFAVGATPSSAVRIISTGNVGIGTDTPTAKLDVNGTLNVSGVTTFQGNVNLGDSDVLYFGDGSDYRIYHSGTDSFVDDNGTGNLYIRSNGAGIYLQKITDNEKMGVFNTDGSVDLYYDNSKKFETTDAGVTISGIATATTFYATNGTFAAGTDTATDAGFILEEEGSIYTRDEGTFLRNLIQKKSNNIIIGQHNTSFIYEIELKPGNAGSVKLHHGGTTDNVKLQTTTSGIEVTGTTDTDQLNVSGVSTFTSTVEITPSSDVKALIIDSTNATSSVNPQITLRGGGPNGIDFRDASDADGLKLVYRTTPNQLIVENSEDATTHLKIDRDDGRVELSYGGDKKFETTANGVTVSGGLNASDISTITSTTSETVLDVVSNVDSGYKHTLKVRSAYDRDAGIEIGHLNSKWNIWIDGGSDDALQFTDNTGNLNIELNQNGSTDLFYANSKKLETTNYGIYVTGVDANTSTIGGAATLVLDPAAVGDNTGTVVIKGDLQIDGTTTTLNSTTLTIDDLNITLADGATNAAAADGAGITVDGANATLTYNSTPDAWSFNKNLGIGTAAPEEILTVYHDGDAALFRGNAFSVSVYTTTPRIRFGTDTAYAGYMEIGAYTNINNLDTKNRDFKLFSTAVDPILYVKEDTGNVGIGTDNPTAKLDVRGSTSSGAVAAHIRAGDGGGTVGLIVDGDSDVGDVLIKARSQVLANPSDSDTKFIVLGTGDVGIGTDNPGKRLDVRSSTNQAAQFWSVPSASPANYDGSQFFEFKRTGAVNGLTFSSTDQRLLAATITPDNEIAWRANKLSLVATNYLSFRTSGGTQAMRITSAGDVGIGTDNPGSKLAVNGYITESTDGTNYWNVVTQSDIGYGSSQVPLNQYLGQLAFLDDYHPNGLRRDGGGSDDVFVDASGNVGIGTDAPGSKLAVNGNITESTDGTNYWNVVTQQDIGSDPDQIPLNQYLGQMAFLDEVGDIPTAASDPQENYSVNFEYVSDTSINIRMRGSDGVVRTANITLS